MVVYSGYERGVQCVLCSRVGDDPNGFILLKENFVDVGLRGAGVDVCAV